MESHILNIYHQAPYRNIGHKILRSISESLSSESSCNQNSPEYVQGQQADEENEEYWERNTQVWSQNQNVNITKSNQDISVDDDENIEVQEVSIDDKNSDTSEHLEADTMEENSLVEGDDYDIIQVFAVDPHLELEATSDEEQEDYCIQEEDNSSDGDEYLNPDDRTHSQSNKHFRKESLSNNMCQDSLEINFDGPVVSNVDEYFIKQNDGKHILAAKDEPVVNDIDEYFIKDTKEVKPTLPPPTIVEELLVKSKLPETDFRISKTVPDEIFESEPAVDVKEPETVEQEDPVADVSIDESDLEVLPNIEELKRYLLDDLPYTKLKNAQKSYSVSLPHSPMHNILDLDAKTCLSFEDLNLDLSDLTFENDKEKSSASLKSDDIPRTLTEEDVNSFLITSKSEIKMEDDFCPQDMDIDRPLDAIINNGDVQTVILPDRKCTSTPIPKPNVLEFCIEKVAIKKETDIKVEIDDFVDVESCNDAVIPVLEANNLNSLLEQFEATEKLNKRRKPSVVSDSKTKTFNVTSGMRLQDAGVQLNKTKMRQILMPSPVNTVVRRSPSPVHSDHDYCSSKKRHSLPNLKGGQSLLKPEVLSSNNKILSSRHRSCKNKKVVYHLSSDDESDANSAKKNKVLHNNRADDFDIKNNKKPNIKLTVKASVNSNHRKKLSPPHSANSCDVDKSNGSVMVKNAFKASDTSCSQNCNGSIKLTIKNKSEVIIKNCDVKEKHKDSINKNKSVGVSANRLLNNINNSNRSIGTLDRNKTKDLNSVDKHFNMNAKQEVNSKADNFYTALFSDKQDLQLPLIKTENNIKVEPMQSEHTNCLEQPQKKKKLNLQEYKLRRNVSSTANSAQVSPEAIFPDVPCNIKLDKSLRVVSNQEPIGSVLPPPKEQIISEAPKTIFDPIREASRKILMNSKKQKAEAMRKRDEDIVMSKIPKVEKLELQPLISDAEMMEIVGKTQMIPVAIVAPKQIITEEKHQLKDYDEMVLFSVGTNTDENMFKQTEKAIESKKRKSGSPKNDNKLTINFKIKKSDHVLKQNVFDSVKRSKSPEKNHSDVKIDKERLKDITATLKSVEKQVDTKISSNSLFASIQDVVKKNAPASNGANGEKLPKHGLIEKPIKYKTIIVRQYNINNEHGEDKVILHLEKNRKKPNQCNIEIQTDSLSENGVTKVKEVEKENSPTTRKRNDSDMSMSSGGSPVRTKKQHVSPAKVEKVSPAKQRQDRREVPRSLSKEKRSRSRDRYDIKYRRSRSHSRGHRRKRSHSRNRSRSRGRFRRYRRSDSPYRRKRRSRTRSPYRSRRSPSTRRDYRSTRTRSRSKHAEKSKSPVAKKRPSPQNNANTEKPRSLTPPLRKPTVSESSDTSISSSSTSSSASSASLKSRRSCSPYKKEENFRMNYRNSFSSEDRESNTPVEERRIVFVGRLEKDLTKASLRLQFTKFGPVTEVRLHSKEDGSRYGFVTFQRPRDAWSAVEAASTFPQYDVGFGGRRAFCRQSYADLDGLEAKYTESAFHGQTAMPIRRNDDMSFEQMLLDIKKKLNKRKGDKNRHDDA